MPELPSLDPLLDRVLDALRRAGSRIASSRGNKYRLTCPAHGDRRPSLAVTREADRVLVFCHAGCKTKSVLSAAGLRYADLFEGDGVIRPRSIAATYEYVDLSGVIVARKVRFVPKNFRWQHPDPKNPNRWLSGYGDVPPGLYRLPDIQDCERVFLCEGEKAVDRCSELGLPACSSPSGASRWLDEWTQDIIGARCGELVVLPDADEPGTRHAEKVAASAYALGLAVKVLPLPGLDRGADAFDWLEHHPPNELTALAVAAPYWEPGARERARAARKRELTRLRVQKHRAKEKAKRRRVPHTSVAATSRFAVTQ